MQFISYCTAPDLYGKILLGVTEILPAPPF